VEPVGLVPDRKPIRFTDRRSKGTNPTMVIFLDLLQVLVSVVERKNSSLARDTSQGTISAQKDEAILPNA
jgi:hypothetical protein